MSVTRPILRTPTLLAVTMFLVVCQSPASDGAERLEDRADAVPMIHVTDLFRPHNDPDDHWDLACVFSLAAQRKVDLRGILIDYPDPERATDPDVLAVAQLNYLTGNAVPVIVGSPRWVDPAELMRIENKSDLLGVRTMLQIMRDAPAPVVINLLGSCRDVALAGQMDPELFATKCRAIYLNAGSGTPDEAKARELEWNVRLDPKGYANIFDLPCPVYWMPCFEVVHRSPSDLFRVSEYGTFYQFRQKEVLPHLPTGLQQFFAYAFEHGRFVSRSAARELQPNWLRYLQTEPEPKLMEQLNEMDRNMWCTGGFLHAVGQTVSREGKIVSAADAVDPVFTFDPIEVTCTSSGVTRWTRSTAETDRYLFHVRDMNRYSAAMTTALRSLLTKNSQPFKLNE